MEVRCYADFDLNNSEHFAIAPEPNRDDLVNWLKLLPIKARISVDWGNKQKLVAYWIEER
jgi:hypothetical protein